MKDPAMEPCERGLRAAALAGDAEAWRALYDSAFDIVGRYARWRSGSADLAEELVQEAWLTAARRLAVFDPQRGTFAEWVCGIVANAARNLLRKRMKHSAKVLPLVCVTEPALDESKSVNNPERVALALAELPDHYEAVLRAKYFDQRSVAEIAAARRETEKAIESQLTRARQAFREAYERRREPS